MTTEHPAANAGAIFLVIIAAGKFQGVMIPQTPTGSLNVRTVVLWKDDGIVSPYALVASSANHETYDAAILTSPRASANVLPFSSDKMMATPGTVSGREHDLYAGETTYNRQCCEGFPRTTLSATPLSP